MSAIRLLATLFSIIGAVRRWQWDHVHCLYYQSGAATGFSWDTLHGRVVPVDAHHWQPPPLPAVGGGQGRPSFASALSCTLVRWY